MPEVFTILEAVSLPSMLFWPLENIRFSNAGPAPPASSVSSRPTRPQALGRVLGFATASSRLRSSRVARTRTVPPRR